MRMQEDSRRPAFHDGEVAVEFCPFAVSATSARVAAGPSYPAFTTNNGSD